MSSGFRVLYRQFLFRLVDLELLSVSAQGDASRLFGQFAALLVWIGVGLAVAGALEADAKMPPDAQIVVFWSIEHFLIATTMLAIGIFAVLSWDSVFPNRSDVLILAPLPVRPRTIFRAKIAGVATALGLVVLLLHGPASLTWPIALDRSTPATDTPPLTYDKALPALDAATLEPTLTRDLASVLRTSPLAPGAGGGITIGVFKHGVRRVFSYGVARPDSIFEIGPITETFTGLLLAAAILDGKAALDTPVRELLPPGTVAKPDGPEITLLDLATHRSGLPNWSYNQNPATEPNPAEHYGTTDLYEFLANRGVERFGEERFEYSNIGFSLLGQALANRAHAGWETLLAQKILLPLGLRDTRVVPSEEQKPRFIPGFSREGRPVQPSRFDALNPATGLHSSAPDMLGWLDANLHPERVSDTGLSKAIGYTSVLRANVNAGMRTGLGWFYNTRTRSYWHNGATFGYSGYALFNPADDFAEVVLVNRFPDAFDFTDTLGEHIRARLAGEPPISLALTHVPASGGAMHWPRVFIAYWIAMSMAGAFAWCGILGLQGLAAQLLPRRLFLRVSSFLQFATFLAIVAVYCLQPLIAAPGIIDLDPDSRLMQWSPSYWFLGMFQQISGSPALAPLARRAWVGLFTAIVMTAVAYTLSYFRAMRRIVEEPDILPSARRPLSPARIGHSPSGAMARFAARTLLRSRQHRMLLAFFLGIGFAVMIVLVRSPIAGLSVYRIDAAQSEIGIPLLVGTVTLLILWIVGARVAFAMPFDRQSNWIWRVVPLGAERKIHTGRRQAFYAVSLIPFLAVTAVLLFPIWPWRAAAGHLAVLMLLGAVLIEISLFGTTKLPFTCSYLPGRVNLPVAMILCVMLVLPLLTFSARMERRILESPGMLLATLLILTAAVALIHWFNNTRARSLQFEETAEPAVLALDISATGS